MDSSARSYHGGRVLVYKVLFLFWGGWRGWGGVGGEGGRTYIKDLNILGSILGNPFLWKLPYGWPAKPRSQPQLSVLGFELKIRNCEGLGGLIILGGSVGLSKYMIDPYNPYSNPNYPPS